MVSITTPSKLRKQILKSRGVVLEKHTRKPITYDELPAKFHKTTLMRLVESKFKDRIDNLIFKGTIYEVEAKLGIDATTVSKWRKQISEAKEAGFWKEFET